MDNMKIIVIRNQIYYRVDQVKHYSVKKIMMINIIEMQNQYKYNRIMPAFYTDKQKTLKLTNHLILMNFLTKKANISII
jgi:hypothetical protein